MVVGNEESKTGEPVEKLAWYAFVGGASRGEFLKASISRNGANREQSHRTSMCSLRYTVHPEHNRTALD